MKKPNQKGFGLLIDRNILKKFHYVARYGGRTATGYMMYLIERSIRNFEKEHGEIELEDDEN